MQSIIIPNIFGSSSSPLAGISTRNGGVSPAPLGMNLSYKVGDTDQNVAVNRSRFLGTYSSSEDRTAFAEQCHSSTVRNVAEPGLHPRCDGLVTQNPGLGLAVSIADCVPVLLYDPVTEAIAALHAGWRGTRERIVEAGCCLMEQAFGSRPRDMKAYIGPAAGVCCYEVGEEVSDQFSASVRSDRSGKRTLDLKKENTIQLQDSGVDAANIEVEERCTICTPDLFHSYRREKERSGRMLAFIMIRKDA